MKEYQLKVFFWSVEFFFKWKFLELSNPQNSSNWLKTIFKVNVSCSAGLNGVGFIRRLGSFRIGWLSRGTWTLGFGRILKIQFLSFKPTTSTRTPVQPWLLVGSLAWVIIGYDYLKVFNFKTLIWQFFFHQINIMHYES